MIKSVEYLFPIHSKNKYTYNKMALKEQIKSVMIKELLQLICRSSFKKYWKLVEKYLPVNEDFIQIMAVPILILIYFIL